MSDDTDRPSKGKAGVRFPFINLEKALGRADELFMADPAGREMSVPSAFQVWEYSEKSSGGFQTIGALKMYGLLEDTASGDNRKVKLTSNAIKYFKDEREGERRKLLQTFALKPKLLSSLWHDEKWEAAPPADSIARSHLKVDRGLSEQAARSLLAIYKENVDFAGLKGYDTPLGKTEEIKSEIEEKFRHTAKVGDFIQWTSDGVDQFKPARKVEWVSPDGKYLRVFGSPTGIKMSEVQVVKDPGTADATPPLPPPGNGEGQQAPFTVYQVGKRLQITADVDAAGLKKLKDLLDKYGEILDMLN